jgi:hypothetical protein
MDRSVPLGLQRHAAEQHLRGGWMEGYDAMGCHQGIDTDQGGS